MSFFNDSACNKFDHKSIAIIFEDFIRNIGPNLFSVTNIFHRNCATGDNFNWENVCCWNHCHLCSAGWINISFFFLKKMYPYKLINLYQENELNFVTKNYQSKSKYDRMQKNLWILHYFYCFLTPRNKIKSVLIGLRCRCLNGSFWNAFYAVR